MGAKVRAILFVLYSATIMAQGADRTLILKISRLGYTSEQEDLDYFKSKKDAPLLLLKELRVIHAPMVLDQEKKFQKELHIIWCLRALEVIFNKRFSAQTSHKFNADDRLEFERQMYTQSESKCEYYFYGFWETHLTYYMAPEDVQKNVIGQWREYISSLKH